MVKEPDLDDNVVEASVNFARTWVSEQIMFVGAARMLVLSDDRMFLMVE